MANTKPIKYRAKHEWCYKYIYNLLHNVLPKDLKIRLIQLYHNILIFHTCKDWPIAVADRLHVTSNPREILFQLRDDLVISIQLGTSDIQTIAEIFGEMVYFPPTLTNHFQSPSIILDIGANKGIFSLFAAKYFPDSTILAYEPDPAIFSILRRNILMNRLQDRCIIFNSAIWSQNNSLPFATAHWRNPGTGRILSCEEGNDKVINVQAVSFRDILRNYERIDIVKIDVEGGEYPIILETPRSDLSKIKFIALEYHDVAGYSVSELLEYLVSAGFTVAKRSRGSILYAWQQGGVE